MAAYWDLFISALIGAVVGGAVDLGFKRIEKIPFQDLIKSKWRRIFIYLAVAFVVSLVAWKFIYPYYEKPLWTFDQSTESWEALPNPQDAAMATEWDLTAKSVRANYNFSQAAPDNPDPEATFYNDNFNDTWSGYNTFILDVTNLNPQSLEMTFSVDLIMDDHNCFHKFGRYRNLPAGESSTIRFDFTKFAFKTCTSSEFFNQPMDTSQMINRIYLIIGTNEKPADFKGAILIDNIRLQKNVWFLRFALSLVALLIICAIAALEYRRYLRDQKLSELARKGDPHAGANI